MAKRLNEFMHQFWQQIRECRLMKSTRGGGLRLYPVIYQQKAKGGTSVRTANKGVVQFERVGEKPILEKRLSKRQLKDKWRVAYR